MTKADIVDRVALGTGLTKLETEAIIEGFLNTIIEALKEGKGIEIRGFGSFFVKSYQPRKGRNPKTGEIIDVLPKKLPFFKVGKELKKKLIEGMNNE
jgi:nucleoid DNA-binding protein